LRSEDSPKPPVFCYTNEKNAIGALKNYAPNFIEELFGFQKKKIRLLEDDLKLAKEKDSHDYAVKKANFDKEFQ
jgi:hypothetical protein